MINKNKIEFFFFYSAQKLFGFLGLDRTRRIAIIVGTLFFYLLPIRKKTTIENLQKAFPLKPIREIVKLARKNYQSIAITILELMCLPSLSPNELNAQVEFDNVELLKNKDTESNGLIIFTGHFGNWEFLMTAIALNIEKQMNILVRPQRNSYITNWLKNTRALFGSKIIDTGVGVKDLYKSLINRQAVGIAGDQRGHFDNPRFNFFNQPTALYTGTASIALRTNSNVLLVMAVRQKDFMYKCFLEELSFENLPDEDELKVKVLTQRYISFIEKYVREYPEQYFWMHKIWKY